MKLILRQLNHRIGKGMWERSLSVRCVVPSEDKGTSYRTLHWRLLQTTCFKPPLPSFTAKSIHLHSSGPLVSVVSLSRAEVRVPRHSSASLFLMCHLENQWWPLPLSPTSLYFTMQALCPLTPRQCVIPREREHIHIICWGSAGGVQHPLERDHIHVTCQGKAGETSLYLLLSFVT